MPENVNTTPLGMHAMDQDNDSRPTMVQVNNVSMVFNMASEQLNSLKEYAIAIARRELRFKEFRALDNVSIEVKKGDVFGILGTNGSGKSTLLKIIAGVLEPTRGTCSINGNIAPLIELGAGFDIELTARENIYLNGALLGYPKRFIEEKFDEIVEFAEVEKFLDMPLKNYSSGMVARIAFAIATVIVPEILIVDEVLSVGDFMFQQKCEKRIMKLIKDYDVTVLIVSHNNDQIERLCNKAIWIEKGHTRMMGTAQEVCKTYRILGGRIGSKASERHVFETLQSNTEVSEKSIETIAGEDRFGTAVKLMEECQFSSCDTVIITSGDSAPHCMIATSLSGAIDAPVLLVREHTLPDVTRQAFVHYQPSRIILLGNISSISEDISNQLSSLCNTNPIVERISGKNIADLSCSVYNFGSSEGVKWGKSAIVAVKSNIGDLISISPLLYMDMAPLFIYEESDSANEDISRILLSYKYDKIITFCNEIPIPESSILELERKGTKVIRFCGDGPYNTNEDINNWFETQHFLHGSINRGHVIVASVWNPFDAFLAGVYAGKFHTAFLLEDPQDIDSVSHALDYIESRHGAITVLTFLGDKSKYNDLDKEVLGKGIFKTIQ